MSDQETGSTTSNTAHAIRGGAVLAPNHIPVIPPWNGSRGCDHQDKADGDGMEQTPLLDKSNDGWNPLADSPANNVSQPARLASLIERLVRVEVRLKPLAETKSAALKREVQALEREVQALKMEVQALKRRGPAPDTREDADAVLKNIPECDFTESIYHGC